MRVVSLPEAGALKSSSEKLVSNSNTSPSTQDYSSSLEYIDTSLETSISYRSSRTGSVHRNIRNFTPSDMPATPSPPSSPESILVVGNDARISRTFLRQCSISGPKACDAEDETGWITWASSPPRPIPALHGPLSLPYARCPSGAEGTIIEDADLPRIIWGLDNEDTQSNSGRGVPVARTRSQSDLPVDSYASSVESATRVQKQPPAKEDVNRRTLARDEGRHGKMFAVSDAKPVPSGLRSRSQEAQDSRIEKPQVWDDAPIDIHALNPYGKGYPAPPSAVWRDTPIDLCQPKKISGLRSAAPDFIPNVPLSSSSPAMSPRIFVEPRAGFQIPAGRRLSAIEIAQRYHAERQQKALPTIPPQPPVWSQAPSLSFDARARSPFMISPFNSHHERESVPSLTSRTSNSRRDLHDEIRQIEHAQRELRNIINLPAVNYSDVTPSLSPTKDPRTPAPSPQDSSVRSSSTIDMSLIFKRLASATQHGSTPNIPSPDPYPRWSSLQTSQSRILQGTRPQSVPMARLIQRRLSVVAEEEDTSCTSSPPARLQASRLRNNDSFNMARTGNCVKTFKAPVMASVVETDSQNETHHAREDKENTEKSVSSKKWRSRMRAGVTYGATQNGDHGH
ncbi:hypothetical protein DXG01_005061 [Tephrocybe rancida]|nr:hypothetical protein DXG01_005061 [Tephrocybe rancida]